MIPRWSFRLLLLCILMCAHTTVRGQENESAETAFFESNIRPALVKHCYECHSVASDSAEGGLILDTRSGLRRGGDRGPAIVLGRPDASLLIQAITHFDPDLKMPPDDEKLPAKTIADLRRWIERGAPDPRGDEIPIGNRDRTQSIAAKHWAYQPLIVAGPPAVADPTWLRRPIDSYVLAKLESESLAPSPDADSGVLLRRVYFDLIGLPPTPQKYRSFRQHVARDGIDRALQSEVEMLLSLPEFGERWGRHWLDVARYAESSGKESNLTFPHAWRYRDYVYDAFNADKPYDRFVTEQMAGDLLPAENDEQRAERLIATGFLAIGPKSLNEMNPRQFQADLVDEQIDAVTRAILASSIACARCHDHKSDPFSMEDYYALAGVFHSTETRFGSSIGPESQIDSGFIQLPPLASLSIPNRSFARNEFDKLRARVEELKWEKRRRYLQAFTARWIGREPGEYYSLQDALRIRWSLGGLAAKLKTVDGQGRALPLAMGVSEHAAPRNVALLRRGEISMPGEIVQRRFPELFLQQKTHSIPAGRSGRIQLAGWLTDPSHPLTSRVMVNRIWQHLFGDGLVRTVNNFGTDGQSPSHPQLLDHLAARFIDDGWSVKSLVRDIVLSRTYRQDSAFNEIAFERDPDNRWLWRSSKRRLDAEVIRDAALSVAGCIELDRPDASLVAEIGDRPISIIGFDKRVSKDLDGSLNRSAYLPVLRDRLPDAIELFDGAESSLVTGRRETTNVPLQSLFLMNSPFILQQSDALADRLRRCAESRDDRIRFAFELCFTRQPDENEWQIAHEYLGKAPDMQRWTQYCQGLLCTAEFRNLD